MLIHGHKFDLRVYVLVTSVDPPVFFLYREGLVRFCAKPYEAPSSTNISDRASHITNYAVNKAFTDNNGALFYRFI